MLYAAELTWRGEEAKQMERGYRPAINRMGRATTGIFQSLPSASSWRRVG